MANDVVEVDIFVAPLKVVDDALIRQLLLHDEDVLEEVDDSFVDVKVVELGNHRLLVLQISLVLINQSVALVDDRSDVIERLRVGLTL